MVHRSKPTKRPKPDLDLGPKEPRPKPQPKAQQEKPPTDPTKPDPYTDPPLRRHRRPPKHRAIDPISTSEPPSQTPSKTLDRRHRLTITKGSHCRRQASPITVHHPTSPPRQQDQPTPRTPRKTTTTKNQIGAKTKLHQPRHQTATTAENQPPNQQAATRDMP